MNRRKLSQPASTPKLKKDNSNPSSMKLEYDATPINNLANAINRQNDAQTAAGKGPNLIEESQLKAQQQGNTIARWSIIVNAVLGIIAIAALWISLKAVREASRSADAAEEALKPYIEVLLDSVKPRLFEAGKPIQFNYALGSLKEVTTKIVTMRTVLSVDSVAPNFDSAKKMLDRLLDESKEGNWNRFLARQSPITEYSSDTEVLPEFVRNGFFQGVYNVYLFGGVSFEQLDNHKLSYYYFEIRFTYASNEGHARLLRNFNTNSDRKEPKIQGD